MRISTTDFKVNAKAIRFCAIKTQQHMVRVSSLRKSINGGKVSEELWNEIQRAEMTVDTWSRNLKTLSEIYRSEVGDVVAKIKGNNEGERLGLMVLRIFGATDIVENELEFSCKMPMGYTALLGKGKYNFIELVPPHGIKYTDYVKHSDPNCPNAKYEWLLEIALDAMA
jgi:hypothetical protein